MQSFINLTESTFPDVAYTCFLYSQQLVFSGLEQDDMRILYRYITAGFLLNLPLDTKPAEEVRRCAQKGFRASGAAGITPWRATKGMDVHPT